MAHATVLEAVSERIRGSSPLPSTNTVLLATKRHEKSQVNSVPCVAPMGAWTVVTEAQTFLCDLCGQSNWSSSVAAPGVGFLAVQCLL